MQITKVSIKIADTYIKYFKRSYPAFTASVCVTQLAINGYKLTIDRSIDIEALLS